MDEPRKGPPHPMMFCRRSSKPSHTFNTADIKTRPIQQHQSQDKHVECNNRQSIPVDFNASGAAFIPVTVTNAQGTLLRFFQERNAQFVTAGII